jgi:hypothetical protein
MKIFRNQKLIRSVGKRLHIMDRSFPTAICGQIQEELFFKNGVFIYGYDDRIDGVCWQYRPREGCYEIAVKHWDDEDE